MDYRMEIASRVAELTGLAAEELAGYIEIPPNPEMGDYAFPCFRLAKALRKAPPAIAADLAARLVLPAGVAYSRQLAEAAAAKAAAGVPADTEKALAQEVVGGIVIGAGIEGVGIGRREHHDEADACEQQHQHEKRQVHGTPGELFFHGEIALEFTGHRLPAFQRSGDHTG